ncbi:protein timeless homolog [Tachypleus tridentatus]|uniref:protein timeless homolog n=1 Tax=Tachypleus tridentatus TaxID=6853 RepID=UPI003FD2C59E
MLHRIAWDRRMYGLLFQASAFRIFQNILHDPQRHEASSVKELARFAKFVVEKFFECAQKNKKVFMEMLFWKSSREVYEIQEGYGSFDKKQSARVLWTEEQEDELRGLYEQYKDVRKECLFADKDVADLIVDNLIDDTKTRRQVIRHLKHLELIKDLKELCHKPTRTRVLIDWREEEEAELRQLYSQFKDASDILGRILENLTVKRPRHRVVEKMLQMGLVNDRQQLRKKRVRKTGDKKQRKSKSKSEANDSDNDEKEVEEEFFQDKVESESEIESQDAVGSYETVDSSNFKDLLLKVLESGLEPGLQWLKLSLESAIEDREDENDDELQAVPLVPLTEDHHQALTSKDFCKLMKSVGICSPANEQETFWRIPVNLNVRMLRTRVNVLNNAISGDFTSSDSLGSTKKLNPRYQMLSDLAKSKEASREVRADNVAGLQDESKCTKTSSKEISSDRRNKLKGRWKNHLMKKPHAAKVYLQKAIALPAAGRVLMTAEQTNLILEVACRNDPVRKGGSFVWRKKVTTTTFLYYTFLKYGEKTKKNTWPMVSLYIFNEIVEILDHQVVKKEKWNSRELINASITNVLNSDSHEDSDSDIGKIASHKKLKKRLIESDDDE